MSVKVAITVDLKNFAVSVLGPQVRAVATKVEQRIAAELPKTITAATIEADLSTEDGFRKALVLADQRLNDDDIPLEDRFDVILSNKIAGAVGFVPTAYALASVTPSVPAGASFGAAQELDRYVLRWL